MAELRRDLSPPGPQPMHSRYCSTDGDGVKWNYAGVEFLEERLEGSARTIDTTSAPSSLLRPPR